MCRAECKVLACARTTTQLTLISLSSSAAVAADQFELHAIESKQSLFPRDFLLLVHLPLPVSALLRL